MKNSITILLTFFLYINSYSQCNIKKTTRPDGNIMEYFNPSPIVKNTQYEIGASIYKNTTTNKFYISIVILFLNKPYKELRKNLTLQTTSEKGISLKISLSEKINMNGKAVAMAMYELKKEDIEILKKNSLKSVYFYLNDELTGETMNENKTIFKIHLNCLK